VGSLSPLFKQRWTFCGVMAVPGFALLLVNNEQRSTRVLVAYDDKNPVRIEDKP